MNACFGELPTARDDYPDDYPKKKAAEDDGPKKAAEDGSITREEVLRLLGAHQEEVEALQAEVARLAAREPGGGGDDGRPDAECLEEMLDAEGEGFTGLPVDRLYEKADESYFFRVQCMVMYNGFDLWTTFHFLFVVVVVAMQIGALQTVWQSVWLVTDFSQWAGADDPDVVGEYYPSGVPWPTDYWGLLEHYDSHKVYGVLFIVVFPLVFTCVCVTISLRAEMEEWKAGYVLFRRELRNFYDNRAAVDDKAAAATTRRAEAQRERGARAVFREVVEAVRAAPKRLLDAYHGVGWLSPVCICLALFHMSARFQRHTQRGGSSPRTTTRSGGDARVLTASYNYTMYAVLVVLLVDAQTAAYVSLADEARRSWRPMAEAAAWFLVDGLVLALIRQIALRYAVHCLLPYTMSEETWPMRFWKRARPDAESARAELRLLLLRRSDGRRLFVRR
ncbi:methyltransferase [Aureococcus anophagefferens]|uniref:Methyltransferase n=1 Tax=Aureococcus anophagefferens TaxID=44056 RepID=A0ABR1FJK4_AURAN